MKKLLSPLILFICFQFITVSPMNAQIGTWTALNNLEPNPGAGLFLLLTDGRIIVQSTKDAYTGWDMLTPDASGSYINGTWTTLPDMNRPRLFFSSQVLPSGKLFVAGGEYYNGDTAGEVYDPVANTWTRTEKVVSHMNIYDGNSILLPNGQVLVGLQSGSNPSFDDQFYNPATNLWATAPIAPLNHDESAWVKLPDSSVLFMGIASTQSCRYRPQTNTWIADASAPEDVYDRYGEEAGCGVLLPNGKAIFFGATQYNDIYTPSGTTAPGTWASAANYPTIQGGLVGQTDAPGAMMVNGHILLCVSPEGTSANNEFLNPAWFIEYDYTTNTFTKVTSPLPGLGGGGDSVGDNTCSDVTLLDLPDGTVLMMSSQNGTTLDQQYFVYTPGSGPIAQGKPTINSILPDACPLYKITGKLFNGISEGTEYGDDLQQSSNYPLVRLSNGTNVYYAKTTNWNRLGAVMTDSLEDTAVFETPANLPSGIYSLVVVVNGFASNPTLFTVLGVASVANSNILCAGGTGSLSVTASGGLSPLSYSWTPGGYSGTSVSNLSAGTYTVTVTDNNGCTATQSSIITQPAALNITADSINTTGGNCNGSAWAIVSGGTGPYSYFWTGGLTTDTISNQCTGSYCSTITDANGCIDSVCVTIESSTGISAITNSSKVTIYPNPNNGKFTILIVNANKSTSSNEIEVYNVLGQQVYSQVRTSSSQFTIDLSSQPNGIYLYRVTRENGKLVGDGKVILVR